MASSLPAAAQGTATRDAMTHFFDANTGDLKAELADARAAGKKAILLMYEQEGCPACLYMKQNVLNRVDVQELYRRHFVSFTVDINGSVPLKDFTGRDITEKAFAAAKARATPTFAFHDLTGAEIVRITGAVRNVGEFKLLAEFVASGAYKTRQFAEYKQLLLKKTGG
ncbi:MAG: thioredoxin fold domain-containing protein [Burkholderiales bacterium]|nr:thioredoxin fold domain-containing protein [Burkholderiales bacterium]